MYRLLIVDDEPIIVDGIYRLLQEEEELELDLYRAYSGDEAMEKLNAMRYDIVLSDIRMPGMSGLKLQENMMTRWPACKVIFLTGHPDFEYVQAAMRNKSVDYILKTESDEEVVRSVAKAVEALNAERLNAKFLDKAAEQIQLAIPSLQREYMLGICEGTKSVAALKPELLRDLYIPLRLGEPVLPVIGRVDGWPSRIMKASDKTLMMYAIHNIAKEHLASCSFHAVNADQNRFIWLIQPGEQAGTGLDDADSAWSGTIRLVHGTLEVIQSTSLQLLDVPVSFATGKTAAEWGDLPACYAMLRNGLGRGLGIGRETMIIVDKRQEDVALEEGESRKQAIRNLTKRLTGSDGYIESGDKEEFMKRMVEISGQMDDLYDDTGFFLEVYYAIASHLLSQVNRWGGGHDEVPDVQLDKLSRYELHATRREAFDYLIQTAVRLFEARDSEKAERTHQVVDAINRYVEAHLEHDLSLTAISEVVYLNPYYMSRLYKQITGLNLSDYIADVRLKKAKELVAGSHLKMHEIARLVGYESPAYFTRIFKKKTGWTPQEFREQRSARHEP
ncbi:response regulator [Paenibacillus sp. GYB003]|uniref:response regulator n=1 Tax=Paenibacillus sp. GYB003 TaxID=2994392 RepID=UPI002F966538